MKSELIVQLLAIVVVSLGILNLIQFRRSVLLNDQTNLQVESSEATASKLFKDQKYEKVREKTRWTYSVDALQYLSKKELHLYQLMRKFESDLQIQLSRVRSWLDDFEDSSLKGTQHLRDDEGSMIEEISSHPFMIFRMIRRFATLKDNLLQIQSVQRRNDIQDYLNGMESECGYQLPGASDNQRAIENIIQLRYMYGLDINDLINGKISTVQTNVGLTEAQAYEIALHAGNINAFSEAIAWLQTLIERNATINYQANRNALEIINFTILMDDLRHVAQKHDDMFDKVDEHGYGEFEYGFTTKILSGNNQTNTNLLTLKEDVLRQFPNIENKNNKGYIFQSICAGNLLMSEKEKAKLYCYYETKLHPVWTINPLKIEIHSLDPYIVRIYDVINETLIEYLQNASKPELIPAGIYNNNLDDDEAPEDVDVIKVDKRRISMCTFLETKNKMLDYVALRIGAMTGLEVFNKKNYPISSEEIQIASYAIGGWFFSHFDAMKNEKLYDPIEGDRLATFMIYLNDVKLGGNTAFPELGLQIQPIKKSAVFWYNLLKNGKLDIRTLHGGCPVLIGQKWISTTWIRSVANFQKRKCSLNPQQ